TQRVGRVGDARLYVDGAALLVDARVERAHRALVNVLRPGDQRRRQRRADLDGGGELLRSPEIDEDLGTVVDGGDDGAGGDVVAHGHRQDADDAGNRGNDGAAIERQLGIAQGQHCVLPDELGILD